MDDETYTRRQYLLMKALSRVSSWPEAIESVSSYALSHPEIDMGETHTFLEWERLK